jgi:hypothetical protein
LKDFGFWQWVRPGKTPEIPVARLSMKKKEINVLVKECFRTVLLKPVEGMRDRWTG